MRNDAWLCLSYEGHPSTVTHRQIKPPFFSSIFNYIAWGKFYHNSTLKSTPSVRVYPQHRHLMWLQCSSVQSVEGLISAEQYKIRKAALWCVTQADRLMKQNTNWWRVKSHERCRVKCRSRGADHAHNSMKRRMTNRFVRILTCLNLRAKMTLWYIYIFFFMS